ncbi:BA75_03483T0 [Komagataella pastoris]|uniref:BA75_03483T0 n=1 Tax=Komagataella pastoris TaxID=4922 RepID=A0A1B2JFL1_PICPA|nr:BA75_03483T0 [Komagataella pastoris]
MTTESELPPVRYQRFSNKSPASSTSGTMKDHDKTLVLHGSQINITGKKIEIDGMALNETSHFISNGQFKGVFPNVRTLRCDLIFEVQQMDNLIMPNLTSLEIEVAPKLKSLPSNCGKLRNLRLSAVGVETLAGFHSESLVRLEVEGCPQLGDIDGFFPSLEELRISHSDFLSNIPLKCSSNLRTLCIKGCRSINKLQGDYPELEYLDLEESKVLEPNIQAPKLRQFNLNWNITKISTKYYRLFQHVKVFQFPKNGKLNSSIISAILEMGYLTELETVDTGSSKTGHDREQLELFQINMLSDKSDRKGNRDVHHSRTDSNKDTELREFVRDMFI